MIVARSSFGEPGRGVLERASAEADEAILRAAGDLGLSRFGQLRPKPREWREVVLAKRLAGRLAGCQGKAGEEAESDLHGGTSGSGGTIVDQFGLSKGADLKSSEDGTRDFSFLAESEHELPQVPGDAEA